MDGVSERQARLSVRSRGEPGCSAARIQRAGRVFAPALDRHGARGRLVDLTLSRELLCAQRYKLLRDPLVDAAQIQYGWIAVYLYPAGFAGGGQGSELATVPA